MSGASPDPDIRFRLRFKEVDSEFWIVDAASRMPESWDVGAGAGVKDRGIGEPTLEGTLLNDPLSVVLHPDRNRAVAIALAIEYPNP
jgi:hypothetical protein